MGFKVPIILVLVIISALGNAYLYYELTSTRDKLENYISLYNELSEEYNALSTAHYLLQSKYSELLAEREELLRAKRELEVEISSLSNTVNNLTLENAALRQQVLDLQHENTNLRQQVAQVQLQLQDLGQEVSDLKKALVDLNYTLGEVVDELAQYAFLPDAFKRTLALSEIDKIAAYARGIDLYPDDIWKSIYNIYKYVVDNIEYSRDPWIPAPARSSCYSVRGIYVCKHYLKPYSQVVQTPYETLVRGEGDCEDQAILLYAMIDYYFRYVHGRLYATWIAIIEMNNGFAHAAVFIPVLGGKLAILDPAGNYMTSILSHFTARPVLEELVNYSKYWSMYGGIKEIKVYYVNVDRGGYTLVTEGDIYSVANYILTHY